MKKRTAVLLMLCLLMLTLLPAAAFADDAADSQAAPETAAGQDDLVTTRHTAVIQGQEVSYTQSARSPSPSTAGREAAAIIWRSAVSAPNGPR